MSWVIKGRGGRLRAGARLVAQLGAWTATQDGAGRFRLAVDEAERDPIGWDNHDPERLTAELRLKTTDWRGHAKMISTDPLVAEIWRLDDED